LCGLELCLDGKLVATLSGSILPGGAVDIYVRPGDLRATGEHSEGVEVMVKTVQRTGPLVRASVTLASNGQPLIVELPHLHHDVPRFREGSRLYLRLMQYSVFPSTDRLASRDTVEKTTLIGRERVREALP
jgi:sulfate transport system ATP-binding protein